MPRLPSLLLFCLLAAGVVFSPKAEAARLFQAVPWKVTREEARDGAAPVCRAKASFALPVGEVSLFDLSFEMGASGPITLTERITQSSPAWMEFYGDKPTGQQIVKGCHLWFDDGAMWPMEYVHDRETGESRYDLGSDQRLLAELASARYLKLETQPGTVTVENGHRVFSSDHFGEFALSNTSGLVEQLRSCQASLDRNTPLAPVTVYEAQAPPVAQAQAMPARLEAARQACRQAPAGDSDALAMAWLRLGLTAADALRLGEARLALEGLRGQLAKGTPATPAILGGLKRLVEILVQSERLDEAFALAKTLPENESLLAVIALSRGDYAGAEQLLCAAASRILGMPVKGWGQLSRLSPQDFRLETLGGLAPAMRRLLLSWSLAALGQEKALINSHCGNCVYPSTAQVPACAAASQMALWVDGDMLREGAPDTASTRLVLGLAAFLRGDSLLRAGYLLTVKSDLASALFELEGVPGGEGWALRTRVALAALTAAQRRPYEALGEVRAAASLTEAQVGRESLPWIEAAALESEVAARLGDHLAAEAAARAGLAAADGNLPPGHSLVLRLKRALCLGLLGQGKTGEAGGVAMNALGLARIPAVSDKRKGEVFAKLNAIKEPPLSPPMMPTNDAEFKSMKEHSERDRLAQGKVTRAKHDILAAAAGLPAISGNMPVAARYERIQFDSPLLRLIEKLQNPQERNGAKLVRHALVFDEYRVEARLEGSDVKEGLSYADMLVGITRGESLVDNDKPLPSGASPLWGIVAGAAPLYMNALDWLSLGSMFPGEKRECLLPGEATEGLERLLAALYRLSRSPEASQNGLEIHAALVHAQAASRGEVLGTLLTRVLLAGDPGMQAEYRHDSQQAVDGELWLRRQRGILLDAMAGTDPVTPRVSHVRALARRLALSQAFYGSFVGNKFFSHVYGDQGGGIKGFESLTMFGSAKYEFNVEKVQKRLGQDEAMVAWLPLDGCTHVFVIRRDTCQWRILPQGQAALGAQVRSIRTSIGVFVDELHKKKGDPLAKPFPENDAQALYQALFGPIENDLAGVSHLYTAQLGVVGGVPLGLLISRPRSADREPDWLADRFAITRMPALVNPEILASQRPPSSRPGHLLLAAGDPVVAGQTSGQDDLVPASIRSIDFLSRNTPRLRDTKQEIETVADIVGLSEADKKQYVLSGPEATLPKIVERLTRGRFKYLLFATHGLLGNEDIDVGEPALMLSPHSGKRTLADDGLLRASDIVGLDLDTDLVLLAACETSPSGEDGAEPLAGLATAFLVAGARAVQSTQWAVVSDAAKNISFAMVAGLRAGQRQPARVLQQALQHLRTKETPWHLERHPAYWAPFEIIAFPR